MSILLRLYPRPWRDRFEEEFVAVLSDRPPSLAARADIVRGAIDAWLQPQLAGPDRVPDRHGFTTLAGLLVLVAALLIAANGPVQSDAYGEYREGSAAWPLLILATVLLSVGLHRLIRHLPVGARFARLAGWIAIATGPLWSILPWVWPIGMVLLTSVMLLLIGTLRAGILPAWLVIMLTALLAIPAALFATFMFMPWYAVREAGIHPLLLVGPLGALWLVVGIRLLRGLPRAAEP
jgi:hypothetical protein